VLAYTYQTDPTDLDYCLTYNDFTYTDDSEACRWPRQTFQPFRALAERSPAVYLGFDQPLPVGLVSIYVAVAPPDPDADSPDELAFVWEYYGPAGWTEMAVLDETAGFSRSGLIQLIGQGDALVSSGLGGDLYRIRARLKENGATSDLPLAGLWPNAAYMTNRFSVTLEALGDSDGNPDQSLYVQSGRVPVLEGELLEVREWSGTGAGWELLAEAAPEEDVRLETDPVTEVVRALWIRWHEQVHLFSSGPESRDYIIERATGRIRFGDGVYGAIPPAGSRVVISYSTGGGTAGNVAAGAITEQRSGVPYLQQATNPVAAEGGAATEEVEAIYQRGPMRLRHRDRAVTALDYEWLAHDASSAVARARCLPLTGPEGRVQRGFVTVVVVPHDETPAPTPTAALQKRVIDYLAARMPASG
jgi:predicted phage baseplate assembly protein